MTLLPLASLAMCGCGVLLVLHGQRDQLDQLISKRIDTLAHRNWEDQAATWDPAKRAGLLESFLFGAIKREVRLIEGTIARTHVIVFAIALLVAGGSALWFAGWETMLGVWIFGLFVGRRIVGFLAQHHYRQFLEHYPAYLDRISKLVEVGNSLNNAMKKALPYARPRVALYVAPALRRHELGVPLATALDIQAKRLGLSEISQLAMVANVNTRYGGSLKDSMKDIVQVERDRARAYREMQALTAEVRASAKVFIALPVLVSGGIFAIHPSYISFFIEDPVGPTILACCAAAMLTGFAIMRRMGNIE